MIRKNSLKLLIGSLLILLPAAIGLVFSNSPAAQENLQGGLPGRGVSALVLFGVPLLLLAVHWLCVFLVAADPKNKNQTPKVMSLGYWLIPAISLAAGAITISAAFGQGLAFFKLVFTLTGLVFVVVGNYLPKCRQNNTIGIKTPWAISSEENWNAVHRFGGRLWVAGGFLTLICAFIPGKTTSILLFLLLILMAALPIIYSWRFYKKQQKQGTVISLPQTERQGKSTLLDLAIVLITVVLITALSYTGNIDISCTEDTLNIRSTYWRGLDVPYSDILNAEYRIGLSGSVRTNGFGSARLSLGAFKNDELGNYTRYTYKSCVSYIVLDVNGSVLVINGRDENETWELYERLLEKLELE